MSTAPIAGRASDQGSGSSVVGGGRNNGFMDWIPEGGRARVRLGVNTFLAGRSRTSIVISRPP